MEVLSTKQAAERLGITVRRVQALVNAGRLPARKIGRDFLIKVGDLRLVKNRKVGRPTKREKNRRADNK
jgi:excisionase family DNA binding protein